MVEYELSVEGGSARVRVRDSSASLADLPREVLEKLASYELVVLELPDRRVYVRGEEVKKLLGS